MSKVAEKRSAPAQVSSPVREVQPARTPASTSNQLLLRQAAQEESYYTPASFAQPSTAVPLRPPEEAKPTAEEQAADELAQAILHALFINVDRIMDLLSGHDESFSQRMEVALQKRHGLSLRTWLKRNLGNRDLLIRAFTLLRFPYADTHETDMALALIGAGGIRDQAILELLYPKSLFQRKRLEREYNKTFAELGNGSLRADLRAAFDWDTSTWIAKKAQILLDRDLTPADELYFDSEAITGAHEEAIVKRLQDEMAKGWANFDSVVQQWSTLLQQPGWVKYDLEETLRLEMDYGLRRTNWEIVRAIFEQYHAYKKGGTDSAKQVSQALSPEQEADLTAKAAWKMTEQASSGVGTAEEPIFKAALLLHQTRTKLILEIEDKGGSTDAAWATWVKERDAFLASIRGSEMAEDSADYARVRAILMHDPRQRVAKGMSVTGTLTETEGNLTQSDEIYLAWMQFNQHDKVVELITKAWARGEIDQLRADLKRGKNVEGQLVRPSLLLHLLVTTRHMALIEEGWPDALRGARQLRVELGQGTSDTQLKAAHKLLTTDGISDQLRNDVIKVFVKENLSADPGEKPAITFFKFISGAYKGAPTLFEFELLLKPPKTDRERLEFATRRSLAGPGGGARSLIRLGNAFTGNDQEQIEADRLARLRYIVAQKEQNPQSLAWMSELDGEADLVSAAFSEHQAALQSLNDLRDQVVEVGASAVELVVATTLSFFTAGTALAFLPGIASTLAGIGVRELALGDGYESFSSDNGGKIFTDLFTAAAGAFVANGLNTIIQPELWVEIERAQKIKNFTETFKVKDVIGSLTENAIEMMADPAKAPSGEQMAVLLAKSITGQAFDSLAAPVKKRFKIAGSVWTEEFQPAFVGALVTGTGSKLTEWAEKGTGGKSGGELAGELAGVVPGALKSAIKSMAASRGKALLEHEEEEEQPDEATLLLAALSQGKQAIHDAQQQSTADRRAIANARAEALDAGPPPEAAPTAVAEPVAAEEVQAAAPAVVTATPAVATATPAATPAASKAPKPKGPRSNQAKKRKARADAKQKRRDAALLAEQKKKDSARRKAKGERVGLFTTKQKQQKVHDELMAQVEHLDVSTPSDTALFYSGPGNRDRAEVYANANKLLTLEMTPGGALLDSLDLFGIRSPITKPQAFRVWVRLSQRYAQQASGEVVGFVQGASEKGVFRTMEEPTLQHNWKVAKITKKGY